MPTIASDNSAEVYVPLASSVTFTPGTGGFIRFGCSTPGDDAAPAPRLIYAAETISIPAGSMMFIEAVNADATYTDPALTAAEVLALRAATVGGYSPGAVFSRSLVGIPHTGTTAATQLLSITIPGNTLGPNGMGRLWLRTSETNNTNVKTLIVRMSGTAFYQAGIASSTGRDVLLHFGNRGAIGSQLLGFTGVSNPFGHGAGTLITSSFNTETDQTIQVIAQLANAGDTFTIEGHQLEIFYGA